MPQKVVTTPYPLIDSDPHAFRVISYFRPSDYATIAAGTAAFPAAIYFWGKPLHLLNGQAMRFSSIADMADPTHIRLRTSLRLGGLLGFVGGFLMAYQRSSCACCGSLYLTSINMFFTSVRFWGWSENKREEERDLAELSLRAREGKPLYGESDQPLWVQGAAHNNSAFSQLKFRKHSRICARAYSN